MSLEEILNDPEYLAGVEACCGGKNKDQFPMTSPWEPPLHSVSQKMGCCGIIDEICPVLREHEHPLVLVGLVAHRWMGARGFTEYPVIDILLRTAQLQAIMSDLVRTGHWKAFDASVLEKRLECTQTQSLREADIVLERTHHEQLQIYYIRFWSEDTYRISIDECTLIEVPDVYCWSPFPIREIPSRDKSHGWVVVWPAYSTDGY